MPVFTSMLSLTSSPASALPRNPESRRIGIAADRQPLQPQALVDPASAQDLRSSRLVLSQPGLCRLVDPQRLIDPLELFQPALMAGFFDSGDSA